MTADDGGSERPIRVLYIANRGEIAARIARTAEQLGIRTALAVLDGPGATNLLDAASVVRAATAAGADALHPGYGFLSENAGFADAVIGAGIRWVGPPPAAIRAMGDKAAARRLAKALGVPTLDGYDEPDQSDEALVAAATRLGPPLLVKPSAGGGGKGMRVLRTLDGLPDAIAGARREAKASFGDDRLILERFVEGPRHVEIQVLFDEHGDGVHLGERDCSLQRRHQKILEESPSPALDSGLRAEMGAAAVRLSSAVGYASAGTVEFLLDDHGRFSFLEMNTRLQVEHPVTEGVTGRDLVADQLRIAEGRPLEIAQDDVALHGHAIEVRLYAEDADSGFLPATGRIVRLQWPEGDGIRVDAGVAVGDEVSGRFDPMLAKIIAVGGSREQALDRVADALDATLVLGLTTNLRFLRWVVREPAVRAGQVRIDTLDHIWPPDSWPQRVARPDALWAFAARRLATAGGEGAAGDAWAGGWRLNGPAVTRIQSEGEERLVATAIGGADSSGGADGVPAARQFLDTDGTLYVDLGGRSVSFRIAPPPDIDAARRATGSTRTGESEVRAPMPGSVLQVHLAAGAAVEAGQPLVTLEAMKMEHVVAADSAGTLTDVLVAAGDQVTKGQVVALVRA